MQRGYEFNDNLLRPALVKHTSGKGKGSGAPKGPGRIGGDEGEGA
jgi:hypothetical protein